MTCLNSHLSPTQPVSLPVKWESRPGGIPGPVCPGPPHPSSWLLFRNPQGCRGKCSWLPPFHLGCKPLPLPCRLAGHRALRSQHTPYPPAPGVGGPPSLLSLLQGALPWPGSRPPSTTGYPEGDPAPTPSSQAANTGVGCWPRVWVLGSDPSCTTPSAQEPWLCPL